MELKEQRYVVTLADTGNLTRAAKKLNISQPALSLYIKNLENYYGEDLFSRENRKLKPTYFGELYIEKARLILKIGDEFNEEMKYVKNGARGRISIGITHWRSPEVLPVLLPKFKEEYPDIEVIAVEEENESRLIDQLDKGRIDFAVTGGEIKNYPYIKICDEKLFILANKDNEKIVPEVAKDGTMSIKPENITDQLVMLNTEDLEARGILDSLKKLLIPGSNHFMNISNPETSALLVKENFGITIIPESRLNTSDLDGMNVITLSGTKLGLEMGITTGSRTTEFSDALIQMIDQLFSREIQL